jgi:predicted transcriptional regulator YdeE
MSIKKNSAFYIVGISARTSNENGQSSQDIPALWNKFMSENILSKIPGRIDDTIYCAYTEYEKDHTKPYTTLLGCKVKDLSAVPEGMKGITVDAGNYKLFTAKGNLMEGAIFQEWMNIWNSGVSRTYSVDFEVYGEKAKDPTNAEVEIFVAVK